MMNADMAIIRDFDASTTQLLFDDGRVDCRIMDPLAQSRKCPSADTLTKAGLYRDSNDLWLSDFKKVLIAMLEKGLE